MTKTEKTAYVSKKEFDELLEYSTSIPTGTTVGKMWKRREPYYALEDEARWILGEYTNDADPKLVGIIWRDLVIGEPADFLDYQI